jgi:hypothetical protein
MKQHEDPGAKTVGRSWDSTVFRPQLNKHPVAVIFDEPPPTQ